MWYCTVNISGKFLNLQKFNKITVALHTFRYCIGAIGATTYSIGGGGA